MSVTALWYIRSAASQQKTGQKRKQWSSGFGMEETERVKRSKPTQIFLDPEAVVEDLDILEDDQSGMLAGRETMRMDDLLF